MLVVVDENGERFHLVFLFISCVSVHSPPDAPTPVQIGPFPQKRRQSHSQILGAFYPDGVLRKWPEAIL